MPSFYDSLNFAIKLNLTKIFAWPPCIFCECNISVERNFLQKYYINKICMFFRDVLSHVKIKGLCLNKAKYNLVKLL